MDSKTTQYSKMVITSALILPLVLGLISGQPANAAVTKFIGRNGFGAIGNWEPA